MAYKGTLLNDVVSKNVVGIRALNKIFNINLMNINYVVQKHGKIELFGSSQWPFLAQKQ
jgi:hypothetical protein